ncbi:MAG: DUF4912 domain-containing protein [Spirochaetales bacterium]
MTRERLDGLPMQALLELSRKESLEVDPDLGRDELIEELFEAFEEDRRERETLNNLIIKMEQAKFSGLGERTGESALSPRDPLVPEAYDENRISLVLRDPTWALALWEVRRKDQDTLGQDYAFRGYGLKVLEHPQQVSRAPSDPAPHPVFLIPVPQAQGTRYIHLPTAGRWYSLELHALYERESRLLGRSALVFTPPELPANPLDRKGLTAAEKRILELSGAWICETNVGPVPGAGAGSSSAIPQRVGDWDEGVLS